MDGRSRNELMLQKLELKFQEIKLKIKSGLRDSSQYCTTRTVGTLIPNSSAFCNWSNFCLLDLFKRQKVLEQEKNFVLCAYFRMQLLT